MAMASLALMPVQSILPLSSELSILIEPGKIMLIAAQERATITLIIPVSFSNSLFFDFRYTKQRMMDSIPKSAITMSGIISFNPFSTLSIEFNKIIPQKCIYYFFKTIPTTGYIFSINYKTNKNWKNKISKLPENNMKGGGALLCV